MTKQSIQALTNKANRNQLTDADQANITKAGLVLKCVIGTSLNDVLARQAKRRLISKGN